jgi:hypothetical protein
MTLQKYGETRHIAGGMPGDPPAVRPCSRESIWKICDYFVTFLVVRCSTKQYTNNVISTTEDPRFRPEHDKEGRMKVFKAGLAILAIVLVVLTSAGAARAVSIDTTGAWTGDTGFFFGNGSMMDTQTVGAVVTALGTTLQSFTFYMGQEQALSSTPFTFAAYVYKWDGTKAQGTELWHSAPVTIPATGTPQPVTFTPTGVTTLVVGSEYVLFVSVSKNFTGIEQQGYGVWGYIWGGATPQTHFVSFNDLGDASTWTTTAWDNLMGTDGALAMKAEFSSVPLPGAVMLLGPGLLGLLALRRRARR